jgi:hypothetical protein
VNNESIGKVTIFVEEGLTLTECIRQEYSNCLFSAGLVAGHPADTMYLKLDRDGLTTTFLLLRPDEMAAIGWLATGVLWSHHMAEVGDV